MKLNLGCGKFHIKGFINIDIKESVNPDKLYDLNTFPYPYDDNSIDEINISHFLEHSHEPDQVLKECLRILKPGKLIKITVPHFTNSFAFDKEHFWFFNYQSFRDYDVDIKRKLIFGNKLIEYIFNKIPIIWENSFLRNIFLALEIKYEVMK